jgi:hypothetical protein
MPIYDHQAYNLQRKKLTYKPQIQSFKNVGCLMFWVVSTGYSVLNNMKIHKKAQKNEEIHFKDITNKLAN